MDLSVEEFVDNLLSDEAYKEPSDTIRLEELDQEMKLPEWFDHKKFNQGRRFFWDFCFGFSFNGVLGLISLYSIPTILNVLVNTRRSNSPYTAYKRYLSTFLHTISWTQHELKPGTLSWKSLYTVRRRHLKAGQAARLSGKGTVSQRDLSLTLFGSMGYACLKPDKFGIRQLQEGDWEAVNHMWRTVGYMLGLQDKYNICRKTAEETRQVCQKIVEKVYSPCLENVPEYFEHMSHVTVEGLKAVTSNLEKTSLLYLIRYIADVPGYIYTEEDRLAFHDKLKKNLKGRSTDTGVATTDLMHKCAIDLPNKPPRLLYLNDFNSLETAPAYKNLPFVGKHCLGLFNIIFMFYSTYFGRIILNFHYRSMIFFANYLPYVAIWRYGFKNAFVNIFKEDPFDDTVPKPNSYYNRTQPEESWFKCILSLVW